MQSTQYDGLLVTGDTLHIVGGMGMAEPMIKVLSNHFLSGNNVFDTHDNIYRLLNI